MEKGKRKKRDHDFSVTAFRVVQDATGQTDSEQTEPQVTDGKNPHAVALGRLGGLKGGQARAERLSSERRVEIARKAARARWGKQPV